MPYIKAEDRAKFARALDEVGDNRPQTAGELNYLITKIVDSFLWKDGTQPRYQDYNDVMGALEGAKLELYARKIRPYEDKKIDENGDVYF